MGGSQQGPAELSQVQPQGHSRQEEGRARGQEGEEARGRSDAVRPPHRQPHEEVNERAESGSGRHDRSEAGQARLERAESGSGRNMRGAEGASRRGERDRMGRQGGGREEERPPRRAPYCTFERYDDDASSEQQSDNALARKHGSSGRYIRAVQQQYARNAQQEQEQEMRGGRGIRSSMARGTGSSVAGGAGPGTASASRAMGRAGGAAERDKRPRQQQHPPDHGSAGSTPGLAVPSAGEGLGGAEAGAADHADSRRGRTRSVGAADGVDTVCEGVGAEEGLVTKRLGPGNAMEEREEEGLGPYLALSMMQVGGRGGADRKSVV